MVLYNWHVAKIFLKIFRHCCRIRPIILQYYLVHKRLAVLQKSMLNVRRRLVVPSAARGSSFRKLWFIAAENMITDRSSKLNVGIAVGSRAVRKCSFCRDFPAFKT